MVCSIAKYYLVCMVMLCANLRAEDVSLPAKDKFHLFLLVGQSNMAGRGIVESQDVSPHPRVLMLDKDRRWKPAIDPLHFDKTAAGVGIGKTFGQIIADSNSDITVGLIPCAVGGSPIDAWKPGVYYPATKSHPWDDTIDRASNALEAGVLKGILWHQGESDSSTMELAEGYEAKLHDLIRRLRTSLDAPDVPFVAGQLGQFPEAPWTDARQRVDVAHRTLPRKISQTAFVPSNGLQHKGDKVHFDAASCREFGKRYADSWLSLQSSRQPLRIATFQIDATPPLGSPLCNGAVKPAKEIVTSLTARGVVLLGAGQPIVLCAFDWVGIANQSHDDFCMALADAVGTSTERVTIHTLHQHDAPGSDFATEKLLAENGLGGLFSNAEFDWQVMQRLAKAAKESLSATKPFTQIGLGQGQVERVASNRRILDPDTHRVAWSRMSASRNPKAQETPEGTIDPIVKLISFWNEDQPIAVMTYYATHPQSYYGQGSVNWDFVGMAREIREKSHPDVVHIHFNGASGNVAAGKYNDGSKENRPILAKRLADGMKLAWDTQEKRPIACEDIRWRVEPVAIPVRDTLQDDLLLAKLKDDTLKQADRVRAGRDLAFLRYTRAGHSVSLTCLHLGQASILHMPGELFVEYQLAAQKMRPKQFVAMAAYGDYGTGYIGTEIAYEQGGYETGIVSRVSPQIESVLINAMKRLVGIGP